MAQNTADYARRNAKATSSGCCAKFVANALQNAINIQIKDDILTISGKKEIKKECFPAFLALPEFNNC